MSKNSLIDDLDNLVNCHTQLEAVERLTGLAELQHLLIKKQYGRFVDQFYVFFDIITHILHGSNYISHEKWPKHRSIQLFLTVYNIKFIYSAFERLIYGFWEDSFVLGRPAYEAFIKIIYISCYPSDFEVVLSTQKNNKRKFNLTNFEEHDLKLAWHNYSFYSIFSHSNKYKILNEWVKIHKEGQKEPIMFRHKFEKNEFEMALNYLLFLGTAFLKITLFLFATDSNNTLKIETIKEAEKLTFLWQETMKTHVRDYWPQVSRDLDKIIEIIKKAENGLEWKTV